MHPYRPIQMFIDGKWLSGTGKDGQDVFNPATGDVIGVLPHASTSDLDLALESSRKGFEIWKSMSALERSPIIRKIAEIVRRRAPEMATVLCLEQGKVYAEALDEISKAAEHFEWMAEEGRRVYGRLIPGRSEGARQIVSLEPVGPVAAFTPWNFPAASPVRKIATALGAGCSIIVKPSEETPASCMAIVEACVEAGVPAGVVNLVFGVPATVSEYLIRSPTIRKVSFTGSVPVGRQLATLCARELKTCTMELGGHSPVLVFDDVDCTKVINVVARGKFRNAGQVCVAPTRFYVQDKVYRRFVTEFSELAGSLRVGDGLDRNSQMGSLNNSRRLDAMEQITKDVLHRGGKVVAGGNRIGESGTFFQPTVFTDMPDDSSVMTVEPFGPVAAITPFNKLEDAVERANNTGYGLAGYAFTQSGSIAAKVGRSLQVGMLAINNIMVSPPEAPIGGVKDSGFGREGGSEGLLEYFNVKYISEAFL